jgi:hypothetical protein
MAGTPLLSSSISFAIAMVMAIACGFPTKDLALKTEFLFLRQRR